MINQTSVQAFHELRNQSRLYDQILDYVQSQGAVTIAMTAKKLYLEKSTVSARINELVHPKHGIPSLMFSHKDKCPVTKKTVNFWKPYETQEFEQASFFLGLLDEA